MSEANRKWSMLFITGAAVLLSMATWFSATAVLPEISAEWEIGPVGAAWLTNMVQLGFVTGALVSSFLAITDIFPLIRIMATASVFAALVNGLIMLEPAYPVLLGVRFLTGVALALLYPPALKLIATWFQKGRGLAMGSMVGALVLGSALPHGFSALGAAIEWQWVIAASSLASLLAALLFMAFVREGPYPFAQAKFDPAQLGSVIRNRPAMLANLGYFGHMWELYAMWGWILVFMSAAIAAGEWSLNASLFTFVIIALGSPSSILGGLIADRIGRCAMTATTMAISGSCALLIGFVFDGPLWLLVSVALLWGFTIVADSAQFSAAVSELSDSHLVGSALSFQMGVGFAITIFTIWLMPQLAEWTGSWRWTFLALVPGPIVGVIAMLVLRRLPESKKLANGRR